MKTCINRDTYSYTSRYYKILTPTRPDMTTRQLVPRLDNPWG